MKLLKWRPISYALLISAAAVAGYVFWMASAYPTAHGNFIYSNVPPAGPRRGSTLAYHASLGLIDDADFLGRHMSRYELSVSDGQGHEIAAVRFTPDTVGGSFNLGHDGVLEWAADGSAVTATIRHFSYRFQMPQPQATL